MTVQRLLTVCKDWKDIFREIRWNRSVDFATSLEPSWPIDAEKKMNVKVRWPDVYQWAEAASYADTVACGLRHFIPVEIVPIEQSYAGIVLFQVVANGCTHDVALDYSDHFDFVNEKCLRRVELYFKMQYLKSGYDSRRYNNELLVPGGYVTGRTVTYKYLRQVRQVAGADPALYEVYGRFGTEFALDIRAKAVGMLNSQTDFQYEGGLKKVRYSRFLLEIARAKICIDLPSNSDFCFRLIDYLAVGACVIAYPHRTTMHQPLEDRKHIVYAREDLSDLVSLCKYYLEHEEEREQLRRNSREYFDRYLDRNALGAWYLYNFQKRLF